MAQLWTIIFVALLALAFGLAHWHDCDEARRREGRCIDRAEEDSTKDQA